MPGPSTIDVTKLIDESPIGRRQIAIVAVCALIALVDGLDIQALAIATPHLSEAWGRSAASFGPVLSASFAGIMLGTMTLGMLGDRVGRRRILLTAFPLVGVASLVTCLATEMHHLIILRFVTGFLIGGCLPNATAMTAEMMPARRTGLAITLMYSAVPMGGVLGSILAPPLIAKWGWQSIFVLGGVAPFLILPLLLYVVPESVRFLILRGQRETVATVLRRMVPSMPAGTTIFTVTTSAPAAGGSIRELFAGGRARLTTALWMTFFVSMAAMYLLTSWLPVMFIAQNWEAAEAIRTLAWFQIGGVAGGLVGGWLTDRIGARTVLQLGFGTAAVALLALGVSSVSYGFIVVLVVVAGSGVIGAQLCLTAFAGAVYPTAVRATGVGWALGLGRLGAVVSPWIGGAAMTAGLSSSAIFIVVAALPMICFALAFALSHSETTT